MGYLLRRSLVKHRSLRFKSHAKDLDKAHDLPSALAKPEEIDDDASNELLQKPLKELKLRNPSSKS